MTTNSGTYKNCISGIGLSVSSPEQQKIVAWNKCRLAGILGTASAGGGEVRVDDYGNLMRWDKYGQFNDPFGWEIDHIQPRALGGLDNGENLRALSCKANRSLGGALSNVLSALR